MIDVADARKLVIKLDQKMFSGGEAVIIDRATEEYDSCFVFHTNTMDFALDPDTDNFLIGTPRYLVDKKSRAVYLLPSYGPSEHFVELFDAGDTTDIRRLDS